MCCESWIMAFSSDAAVAGLLWPETTAGFDDRRMNPSCVRAQVAQRSRPDSSLPVAAAWNWWFGQARASSTFTSRSSRLEVSFFIDHTLHPGCRNDWGARRYLERRKSPCRLFSGCRSRSREAAADESRKDLAQAFA